jgi:anti-sigma B factor antagonist
VRLVGIGRAGEVVSVMSARGVIPGGSGFSVPWFRRFAVADMPVRGAGPLTVSVSAREGYTLVSLHGEGDVTVRARLRDALSAQVTAESPHLVVDLAGLVYMDASCVQVLWRVSRMAEGADGMLGLVAPQPLVARVMELWGAGQVIGVHESVAEAIMAAAG